MKMFSSLKSRYRYGFTLIELLLVIGIIAILASIVIVAINPTKQLGEARNAQRRSDVNAVLQAVYQYAIDNNGALPGNIGTEEKQICDGAYASETCTGADGVDLSALVGTYITAIPRDPQQGNEGDDANWTGYSILQTNNRVTVSASGAELGASISVTR